MSVKIIAELNPFSTRRIKITAEAKPIAEIIQQLNTGFPLSQARVCRNGEIIKDFSIAARDGDSLSIKFVPAGSPEQAGTGMKIGGWALAAVGAVLIMTGYGAAFGVALIGAGVGLITGGTVLMNIKIPTLKDTEKPENDPSIRGGKNQARPHGRIPALFGRHRVYPDLAANPHTQIIGNQQYFTQLFCGGYKDCVIDINSFKLGETSLVEFSQTKDIALILSGADPIVKLEILQNGEASSLYPYCVHEDAINAPLQNLIDGAGGGKISGEIIRTTPDDTDAVNVDIFLHNGIGKYKDNGALESASVEMKALYKPFGAPDSSYTELGLFGSKNHFSGFDTISGAELKTKRFQITKSGLPRGKYTVRIERVRADSTDSKIVDQVHIGSIRSIKSERPIRDERQKDLTVIALRVMATGKLNNVVDSFNYVASSKLPVHSSSDSGPLYWLGTAQTRNPASMLLYALRGRAAQQSVDPEDIDWHALESFYSWCEEHGYACDAYLSESVTMAELLRMIGGTARADILRIDSKISVVQDIERPSPVQLFTPKNTKGYSVNMLNADIPDSIALRFIDEESGYAQNEAQVYHTPDGNKISEPETVQKVDLWGVTNSVQARRIGMYNYACLKNRPFVHTIEVDIEYLMCNKGDWMQYAGDLALTGSVQGRITGLFFDDFDRCVGISVDEQVETDPAKQYAVRLRKPDGSVLLKDAAIVRAPNEIYFTEPFSKNDAPMEGDIYAFGIRGQEVIDLIITDIQPQADLSAVLTCVEYSPAIFGADDPDFILPEFENKITPVSGAVDSGLVGPSAWKLFIVYHDSEEEPLKPDGDGQNAGWHYAQTLRSIWQSSKMAASVDSGEWGPAVRIKNSRDSTDVVPFYLTLSVQSKILDCDSEGNILAGLLPFTSQAALYKWNWRVPAVAGIERFPGTGGDLFDPMLGSFVPTSFGINFSLKDAPEGVSIDRRGMIAVSADAELEDEHSITVQAEYEGAIYSAVLFIQVRKREGEARYLGTAETIPQNDSHVTIIKGPVHGLVRALQGNYVLAVANGTVGAHVWRMGYVYQWTGIKWEERDPVDHTDLYTLCLKDGLEVEELKKDMAWFGAIFAARIVAIKAFIEELQVQVIELKEGGQIKSNYTPGLSGFLIDSGGKAEFNEAVFRGDIFARSGHFTGDITSGQLLSSNSQVGINTPSVTFINGIHTVLDVWNYFGGAGSHPVTSGSYGGQGGLWLLRLSRSQVPTNNGMALRWLYRLEIEIVGQAVTIRQYTPTGTTNFDMTLGGNLVIDGGSVGATFRLINVPNNANGLPSGCVYRDSGNVLRIVP